MQGLKKDMHTEGVPGSPRESSGFRARQATYPAVLGGRTHVQAIWGGTVFLLPSKLSHTVSLWNRSFPFKEPGQESPHHVQGRLSSVSSAL